MALADSAVQREHDKFVADSSGDTAVRVIVEDSLPVENVAGTQINPATEEKQDDIISAVGAITPTDVSSLATSSNQTNGTQQTRIKETAPTDATKTNGSLVITRDGDGNPTTVAKTIGATTYTKTLTWTSGNLTAVSVWV